MNLVLSFVHPRKDAKTVGPFRYVRLDGDTLRDSQDAAPIAVRRDHQWQMNGERYFSVDVAARIRIQFERPVVRQSSRWFGPYGRFSAMDGIVYTDNHLFAFVDANLREWFCYGDGLYWPVMIVMDASSGTNRWRALAAIAPLVPGVVALWQGAQLLYMGAADSIRSQLERLATGDGVDGDAVTCVTWDVHADPASREAQLRTEYARGARSLATTYGRLHGNAVRTRRLIERAKEAMAHAELACARARGLVLCRRAM